MDLQKIGLVLEGGANRGIFTSGVLDCLKENDIYFPYVVSVSVGTCNAIDYVSRQIGRTRECMIPHGRNIPPICWKNIFIKRTLINLDMVFDEYPNRLIPFDYDTFWKSSIISEYVVTNCITGKAEYFSAPKDKDEGRLMKICRASCSMPYVLPEIYIDGTPYLDGGCADPIPFRHAMEMGYEKNLVVVTREAGYSPADKTEWFKRMEGILYRKYPELVKLLSESDKSYRRILKEMDRLEQQGRLLVIRPIKELAGRLESNQNRMEAFYKQGYDLTYSRLEEIKRFIV